MFLFKRTPIELFDPRADHGEKDRKQFLANEQPVQWLGTRQFLFPETKTKDAK